MNIETGKKLWLSNFAKRNQCVEIARRYKQETKWDWLRVIGILCIGFIVWVMACGIWG
jgi:hypothetical protein